MVSSTGLADRPDLIYTLRLYDSLPFGDIEIVVRNPTGRSMTVQSIRVVEASASVLSILENTTRRIVFYPTASVRIGQTCGFTI